MNLLIVDDEYLVGYWFLERNFKMMNLVNSINRTPGAAEGRFANIYSINFPFIILFLITSQTHKNNKVRSTSVRRGCCPLPPDG